MKLYYKEYIHDGHTYYDFYLCYNGKNYLSIKPSFNKDFKYLCMLVKYGLVQPLSEINSESILKKGD